ncbi:MAG: YggT family protein [Thermoanaerobacterales bacterium]|nr:YggT family protein [Bacillota bacterium]MDI6906517.1 YggT family protein [Thermoanaerobacterales bacterium]
MSLLIQLVNVAFQVYSWLMIARILLSWVRHDPRNPIIRFIYEITEPFLGLFRRIIPPIGMVDISPIAAFIVLDLIRRFVLSLLWNIS